MTIEEYNNLNDQEKLNVAWLIWRKYIDLDSPDYNKEFHYQAYGSRRLFVNSRKIAKRGIKLFKLEIIHKLKMEDIPNSEEKDFPIPNLGKIFEKVQSVRVHREIPKERFHWIDFEIAKGDIFINKNSNGHGTCSSWGLGCNNENFDWTCEIPLQYIEPLPEKNSKP